MHRRCLVVSLVGMVSALGVACGDGGGSDLDLPAGITLSADARAGQDLAQRVGCASCHSADGSDGVGPSFAGLWGAEVELEGGKTVTFDRAYFVESVRDPSAKRPVGVSGQMPEFGEERVSDAELGKIRAYLEALAKAD